MVYQLLTYYQEKSLNEKEIDDVEIHSLNKVLKDSNIISLHLPLTEQTNHIIDTEQFDLMNKDTILINVSRGGLINEEALIELSSLRVNYR